MTFEHYFMLRFIFYTPKMASLLSIMMQQYTLTLGYIRHDPFAFWQRPYTLNLFHIMLIGFGFLFLPLNCLNQLISWFPQSQYSAHYVVWPNMVGWGLSTNGTPPFTIRSSPRIYPPTIRMLFTDQPIIILLIVELFTSINTNQIPKHAVYWPHSNHWTITTAPKMARML